MRHRNHGRSNAAKAAASSTPGRPPCPIRTAASATQRPVLAEGSRAFFLLIYPYAFFSLDATAIDPNYERPSSPGCSFRLSFFVSRRSLPMEAPSTGAGALLVCVNVFPAFDDTVRVKFFIYGAVVIPNLLPFV